MIDFLEHIDKEIFFLINGNYSNTADLFFEFVSRKLVWIPFYLVLLILCIKTLKSKWWILLIAIPLLVTATDQVSVHLFKNVFLRYRPCHNLELSGMVHIVNGYCGGKYGFISSHAANAFGLATFVWLIIRNKYKYWFWILFIGYASLIAYSRVYLGVHYPSDVAVGALVGIVIGAIFYFLVRWVLKLVFCFHRQNNNEAK